MTISSVLMKMQRNWLVFRVGADGKRTLFTRVALPQVEGWSAELQDLAKALGENLLIDSPVIRRILNV
jgi:hypothetical protein